MANGAEHARDCSNIKICDNGPRIVIYIKDKREYIEMGSDNGVSIYEILIRKHPSNWKFRT